MKKLLLLFVAAMPLAAQAPVVGVGTFIHVVADLDKTMRFYGDRLGLERTGQPGPRPFGVNTPVESLYDVKGSQSRVAVYRIPGSPLGLEFAQFKDAAQKTFRPRPDETGASVVVLPVPDVAAALAKLKEDATPMVNADTVADPDGFYVQLVPQGSGAKLRLTVDNMDRTMHLFRDLLGFQPEGFAGSMKANVPGTELEVQFVANKGSASSPAPAIHDIGAGVLRLMVRDSDALFATLKSAGVPVASAGGEMATIGTRHYVIMRDPDNFFFQLAPAQGNGRNSAPNLTPPAK